MEGLLPTGPTPSSLVVGSIPWLQAGIAGHSLVSVIFSLYLYHTKKMSFWHNLAEMQYPSGCKVESNGVIGSPKEMKFLAKVCCLRRGMAIDPITDPI